MILLCLLMEDKRLGAGGEQRWMRLLRSCRLPSLIMNIKETHIK